MSEEYHHKISASKEEISEAVEQALVKVLGVKIAFALVVFNEVGTSVIGNADLGESNGAMMSHVANCIADDCGLPSVAMVAVPLQSEAEQAALEDMLSNMFGNIPDTTKH